MRELTLILLVITVWILFSPKEKPEPEEERDCVTDQCIIDSGLMPVEFY